MSPCSQQHDRLPDDRDEAKALGPSANAFELRHRELLHLSNSAAAAVALPFTGEPATAQQGTNETPRMMKVQLRINGEAVNLVIDSRQSLLDVLREDLFLTGTKKGCNQGACGACTVLLDGERVNSCLTLAVMHDGAEITTIEGLAQGEDLHPLQQAFIDHEGFQCGYCTSGQIMSGVACIREGHASSRDEIRFWMSGNICRCGAYPGIVAAVEQAAKEEHT
ncbi:MULTISPECIES: (2Fe-2S)-binding protein [unclassified Sinorhizobium]|uniref:(2Fe-2S)-binding protein n=1 Tax=unclassified Sinorhizobium TaxID=2613772 RepID=UPI0035254C67